MIGFMRKRPWPVHAFAIGIGGFAIYNLVSGLLLIDPWISELNRTFPEIAWNRDSVIVALSTRFTIVMIPVVAIWGFGSRLARLLVAIMVVLTLPSAGFQVYDRFEMGILIWGRTVFFTIIVMVLTALLFKPSARRWFSKEREIDPATFA